MNRRQDDELERYLRGGDGVSGAYRRTTKPSPPRGADRRVLALARRGARRATRRDAFAYAACALLALAVLFAIGTAPRPGDRGADAPHFVRTAVRGDPTAGLRLTYPMIEGTAIDGSDPRPAPVRPEPRSWLERIAALRAAGRSAAADAEYRRFLAAYPGYAGTH